MASDANRHTSDANRHTSDAYRHSGVDLDIMDGMKDRIKAFAAMTHGPEVLNSGGSFAGLYQLTGYSQPVLVASTDGVGTKLKIASLMGHFESVGQDLVTLNVNDILTRGAKPLFFLDYVSFSDLDPQNMDSLMRGMTWGCREVGCALIGGETAQLPGTYSGRDLDLAGFVVGVVERDRLIQNENVIVGDYLFGIPSAGCIPTGIPWSAGFSISTMTPRCCTSGTRTWATNWARSFWCATGVTIRPWRRSWG